jgi:hypothetical protein
MVQPATEAFPAKSSQKSLRYHFSNYKDKENWIAGMAKNIQENHAYIKYTKGNIKGITYASVATNCTENSGSNMLPFAGKSFKGSLNKCILALSSGPIMYW